MLALQRKIHPTSLWPNKSKTQLAENFWFLVVELPTVMVIMQASATPMLSSSSVTDGVESDAPLMVWSLQHILIQTVITLALSMKQIVFSAM